MGINNSFVHYSATGNTFLIFDDRLGKHDLSDEKRWVELANRYGVDGLLFLQQSTNCDFRMRYFNRDGGEVEMCGNGARALCVFARDELKLPLRVKEQSYHFETFNGPLQGYWDDLFFGINMGEPKELNNISVSDLYPESRHGIYVNTGVPHVVYEVNNVETVDLMALGKAIRYDTRFVNGTNINFYQKDGDLIKMRTYERGVEAETLSCGTGTTAVALSLYLQYHLKSPLKIQAPGGHLVVSWDNDFLNPLLAGPVEVLARGEL